MDKYEERDVLLEKYHRNSDELTIAEIDKLTELLKEERDRYSKKKEDLPIAIVIIIVIAGLAGLKITQEERIRNRDRTKKQTEELKKKINKPFINKDQIIFILLYLGAFFGGALLMFSFMKLHEYDNERHIEQIEQVEETKK